MTRPGGLTGSPGGLVPAEACAALDAVEMRKRLGELELRVLVAQTEATEQKALRLGSERDLCTGVASLRDDLTRLEAQTSGSCAALGETLMGLGLEGQRLRSKLQGPELWGLSDPWTAKADGTGPKGAP